MEQLTHNQKYFIEKFQEHDFPTYYNKIYQKTHIYKLKLDFQLTYELTYLFQKVMKIQKNVK